MVHFSIIFSFGLGSFILMIPLVLAIKYQNKKCKCKRKIIVLPGEIVTIPEISYYSDDNSDDNSDNNSNNNSDNEIRSIIL